MGRERFALPEAFQARDKQTASFRSLLRRALLPGGIITKFLRENYLIQAVACHIFMISSDVDSNAAFPIGNFDVLGMSLHRNRDLKIRQPRARVRLDVSDPLVLEIRPVDDRQRPQIRGGTRGSEDPPGLPAGFSASSVPRGCECTCDGTD